MDENQGHPHLLLWYVSGDLDTAQALEIEDHLAVCRECTAEATALASMLKNLKHGEPIAFEGLPADAPGGEPPRSDPPARERIPAWRKHLPALAACAAAATLIAIAIPAAVGRVERNSQRRTVREAQSVILSPPQRGDGGAMELAGGGPWAISVMLPFGAPSGLYDLSIEGVDQPAAPALHAALQADMEGRLSLIIESLPRPGRFVVLVRPRGEIAATPYIYSFQTVAGATDGA